jgi:hypothetical protein
MATVDKNFRIKNGLVIEGSTATLNGNNILSEDAGDSYILNLVGGATLVKSVDTDVFTVDNAGNLTINVNTFDSYGSATDAQQAAEATAATDATTKANAAQAAAEATAAADATSKANAAQSAAISAAATDATTKANAAQAAAEGYADSLASNYDPAGSATAAASQALTDAQNYADAQIDDTLTSTVKTWSSYKTNAEISSAQTAAQDYADGLINDASNASDEVWSAYKTNTEIGLAEGRANTYTDEAVADLVNSAPSTLDTLKELADALQSNPDVIQDLQDVAAGKQDTLTAGANIDITGSTISVTGLDTDDVAEGSNLYFTNQRAIDAVGGSATSDNTPDTVVKRNVDGNFAANDITANEISFGSIGRIYDDGDLIIENTDASDVIVNAEDIRLNAQDDVRINANDLVQLTSNNGDVELVAPNGNVYIGTNNDPEHVVVTQGTVDNILNGGTPFTDLNINDVAKQVAARSTSLGSVPVTAYQFNKGSFKSGKFLVKIDNGTHNEISEILLTLDSSDNVAITEYAIVGTNGPRGTITATVDATHCQIVVTPVNDSTITVAGTVFSS